MADVYILYSTHFGKHYIGSCKDSDDRLDEHLTKMNANSFTSKAEDWEPVLVMKNLEYSQARKVEKHIKSMKSSRYILNLIQYPEMREKLVLQFRG